MDKNFWQLGTWLRVPVSMHWTVLLSFAWLYLIFWNVVGTLVGSVAFFFLLVVHVLGHVVALRRMKIPIEEIRLFGIHGEVAHGYASPRQAMKVAWAGVGVQFVILLAALAASWTVLPALAPVAWVAAPVLTVFINLNIFLIIVALLPIGPFDGHDAWKVIPMTREGWRKRRKQARQRKMFPEESLPPDRRAKLEQDAEQVTADLLKKLSGKGEIESQKKH